MFTPVIHDFLTAPIMTDPDLFEAEVVLFSELIVNFRLPSGSILKWTAVCAT